MAGEWIKVEITTQNKPEVFRIARYLNLNKDAVLGKLIRFWSWFDANSVDGVVDGVVDADVDALVEAEGFAEALKSVSWLQTDNENEHVSVPNFDRHNGQSAKKRATKNRRQDKWRNGSEGKDDVVDAQPSTSTSTREEKRREEKKIEKNPSGKKRQPARASTIPEDFTPNETCRKLAIDTGISLADEVPQFIDFWLAKGETKRDWQAAFRTWLRNAKKYSKRKSSSTGDQTLDDILERAR